MSDDLIQVENKALAELNHFTQDQLNALGEYAITTVGELLGATKGLRSIINLNAVLEGLGNSCANLRDQLPGDLIAKYEADSPMPATGYKPEGDEDGQS